MKALGMIEVYGYLTAVAALDSALKAANVQLMDVAKVRGGLVTVMVTGDVGAVKAAMDASTSEAKRIGTVVSVHVIPRPADSIESIISRKKKPVDFVINEEPEIKPAMEDADIEEAKIKESDIAEPDLSESENQEIEVNRQDVKENSDITEESMQTMTVENLRNLARKLEITNLTRKEIKFANKKQLIESIKKFLEQER